MFQTACRLFFVFYDNKLNSFGFWIIALRKKKHSEIPLWSFDGQLSIFFDTEQTINRLIDKIYLILKTHKPKRSGTTGLMSHVGFFVWILCFINEFNFVHVAFFYLTQSIKQ